MTEEQHIHGAEEANAAEETGGGDDRQRVRVNQKNLYREETFSDLQVAVIRQLSPVKPNGETDKTRKVLFAGQTQIMTPQGPLPIQFPIDAKNLQQALDMFPEAMEAYVEDLMAQAREMQRRESSRLIVPNQPGGDSRIIR
ncbi:MAG TPA: hypothetical protein PLO63_06585 [Syntrophales bacterium]|nr:hypothetical protein [Syntrophales bacterium]